MRALHSHSLVAFAGYLRWRDVDELSAILRSVSCPVDHDGRDRVGHGVRCGIWNGQQIL